jgi:hypothetical protein
MGGEELIQVGDGTGFSIHHLGNTSFSSSNRP